MRLSNATVNSISANTLAQSLSCQRQSTMVKSFHQSLLSTCCLCFGLLTVIAANHAWAQAPSAQKKPGKTTYKFSALQLSTQAGNVADSQVELQRDNMLLNVGVDIALNQQWSLGASLGFDKLDYDWRHLQSASSATAPLFAASGDAWNNIERYRASMSLSYRYDQHWMFMFAPQLQYAYAQTASSSNAKSYGLVASGLYRFDSGNMLGLGIAYLNDIDEVRTVPFLAVRWQISERWVLGNPFQAGFSGPAGMELSYQINPDWNVGFGSSKRTQRFLIEDPNTVVEVNEWVGFARAGWQVTPVVSFNAYAGYFFGGELEVSEQASIDMDSQGAAALDIHITF